jgi:signal transduction histidine kinase
MLDTATPRFLTGGGFAGYVGIAIDITDLRRNQERMSAAQKLESIGILVAGLAHRFNNLLGTIIAEGDLAASEIPLESTARDGVLRMNTAAMRASEIVALLMAYAGGGLTAHGHAVNLTDALEETLRLFKATAYKSVRFSADLPRTLPAIRADLSRVRQVVMNLLTNALEALPDEKGSIGLKASLATIGFDAAHPGLPPGEYVRIEVRDTGPGIPEEARARIFDPFYTTKALGRGLGLAAVQGIIRHLGGAITVRNGVEQGATFEVLLPVFRGLPDEY